MIYSPCRYWKAHPLMGYIPSGFCKTRTHTCQNPHPWMRVRVLTGTGAGCPGKPQGSPWHSLEADTTPMHLSVHLSLQNHSSIKSNYYMIYMKYYAWIPTRTKPPNLYMFRISSANHIFLLLVTHAKCKQIRTISLLPPDVAKSCPRQYKARFSLV